MIFSRRTRNQPSPEAATNSGAGIIADSPTIQGRTELRGTDVVVKGYYYYNYCRGSRVEADIPIDVVVGSGAIESIGLLIPELGSHQPCTSLSRRLEVSWRWGRPACSSRDPRSAASGDGSRPLACGPLGRQD